MKKGTVKWTPQIVERDDGTRWSLGAPSVTSDGFAISMGTMIDENDEPVQDEMGFPVIHSFFLGAVR